MLDSLKELSISIDPENRGSVKYLIKWRDMPTVRKYLENIVNRSMRPNDAMRDKEDAEAALKLISSSERLSLYYGEPEAHTWAVVADPGPSLD